MENTTGNTTFANKKSRKRIGRGISAGGGKTAGRGTKGQKSRAGHNIPRQFEGGQSNLSLRLPKVRGFKSHANKDRVVTLSQISEKYKAGETVNRASLINAGLLKKTETAKILATGTIDFHVIIEDVKISKGALSAIEKNLSKKTSEEAKKEPAKKVVKKSTK